MNESDHVLSDLCDALLMVKTQADMRNFLKDLCTPQELKAFCERWRVCRLLDRGDLSYRDIHDITGASLTTIGRVARSLKDEPYQGYRAVLKTIKKSGKI